MATGIKRWFDQFSKKDIISLSFLTSPTQIPTAYRIKILIHCATGFRNLFAEVRSPAIAIRHLVFCQYFENGWLYGGPKYMLMSCIKQDFLIVVSHMSA